MAAAFAAALPPPSRAYRTTRFQQAEPECARAVVDVFEEVEEELRADRLKSLARRLLPWALLGVVIGLLPTTGLTLPFISYGRSNILLSLLTTGILLNIGSQAERVHGATATDPMTRR